MWSVVSGLLLLTAPASQPAASAPAQHVLTLQHAEELTLSNQPTLRGARASSDAAAGRVEQARSGYLPQLTATAQYNRQTGNFAPRPGALTTAVNTPPTPSLQSYDYFNFGASFSQLVYDFGQTNGRWKAAEINEQASRVNERSAEQQALLNVRRAYFQACALRDLLTVARDTTANQARHLDQIRGLVEAELRPTIDLASAKTNLANARAQEMAAAGNLSIAIAQLNQAMGMGESVPWTLGGDTLAAIDGEGASIEPLVESALLARPEFAALEKQRQAQETTVSALKGGYGPSLNVIASGSIAGTRLDFLVPNWTVGALLTWPLFSGGMTSGQVHEARGTLDSIIAQEDALRLQIRVDVEQAVLSLRSGQATAVATAEAKVNASEQLRLAESRYANGLGSVIELGDAQVASTNAAAQDVQAHYNVASARAQLLTALGQRSSQASTASSGADAHLEATEKR